MYLSQFAENGSHVNSTMADREKRGEEEVQKFEYLKKERSFFGEIKSIFPNFQVLSFGEIYENIGKKFYI